MSGEDVQKGGVKENLVEKLAAIQGISIPDSVAGKSTEKVRSSIKAFCTALQAYIDAMGGGQPQTDSQIYPADFFDDPEKEKEYLLGEIAKYGITIDEGFDNQALRNILNALTTYGEMIQKCIDALRPKAPSLGYPLAGGPAGYLYGGSTPSSAFRMAFFPFGTEGNDSKDRPINMASQGSNYFAQTLAFGETSDVVGPDNPIDYFTIELPPSTFEQGGDSRIEQNMVIERNIRHEIAHVLIDLINEKRGYERINYNGYQELTLFVEYLDVIEGEIWDQDAFYDPGFADGRGRMFIEVDGERIEIPPDVATKIQETYYFNATRQTRGVHTIPGDLESPILLSSPAEDWADTAAVYPELPPAGPLDPDAMTAEQIIANSPRVSFFRDHFCCWVYELLGLNLDVLGCLEAQEETEPIEPDEIP